MKQLIRHGLRHIGLDVKRAGGFKGDTMDFAANRNIDLVLDVGANEGQFSEALRARGYRGRIISFEPIPAVYRILARKAAMDGRWEAHNIALGEKAGDATINVAKASVFSSLLPPSAAAVQHEPDAAVTHAEPIHVRRLDEIGLDLTGNVLLKIDTQGYERQVLEGAEGVLPRMKGVLMELPLINLYEGNWSLPDAVIFMAASGFVPAQIHPVSYHALDPVSVIEVDCLFRPRDDRLDDAPSGSGPAA